MSYIYELTRLSQQGHKFRDIVENFFLNYGSFENSDLIFMLKKALSQYFHCDLKNIRLIGSSHTGFKMCNQSLLETESPSDYDFAIIDAQIYAEYIRKTHFYELSPQDRCMYKENLVKGKCHPRYQSKNVRNELHQHLRELESNLHIGKHISVCFYVSEDAFIDGLEYYYKKAYTEYLSNLSRKDITRVPDYSINELPKGME